MLWHLYVAVLLGAAAYQDWKRHAVRDELAAMMWLFLVLAPVSSLRVAVFCFGFFYLAAALVSRLKKKELMGWADVLILPIFLAGVNDFPLIGQLATVMVFVALLFTHKKGAPLVLIIFFAYILGLAFSLFQSLPMA